MRRTPDVRPRLRTRAAAALSLLTGAGLVAGALYAPDLLAGRPAQAPPAPVAAVQLDPDRSEAARRQVALVEQEDERLLARLRAVPWAAEPYLDRAGPAPTLVLTPTRSPYSLDSLIALGAATRAAPGIVDLTASVLVTPGAALAVEAPDTLLRMASTPAGFTSVVGWKGSVSLAGSPGRPLTVLSWDPVAAAVDRDPEDGRAYLRVVGSTLRSTDVSLSDLGFWSGRTGGVALTGSDGIPAGGEITRTAVRRGHYGLYSADTANLTVSGSSFDANTVDGVLLHRGTTRAVVRDSSARGNLGDGIAVGRGASEVELAAVVTARNSGDGILLDGRPMADRPGPAGMSLDGRRGFTVRDSTSRFNGGSGIEVRDADDVVLSTNTVGHNPQGIVVHGLAERVLVDANTVTASGTAAIAVRHGPTATVVAGNTVSGAMTGVQVRDAVVDVRANSVTAARDHGVSFQGAVHGSAASANVLAGSGPSGLDLRRTGLGAAVTVSGNDDTGWQVVRPLGDRVAGLFGDRPLLILWLLVLVVPVVATLVGRRRRSRTPYAAPPVIGTAHAPQAAARPAGTGPDSVATSTRVTLIDVR